MQRYEATTKYVGSGTYVGILVEDDTGEYVRHDDAQAEIARLRAEREAAHASINQHLGQTAAHRKEADALLKEIDAAHAALGIGPRDAVTIAEAVEALKRERDTARAALDKEREATLRDLHRELIECGREWQANGHRPTHDEYLRQVDLVARRAAEAKEPR